MQHKDIGLFVAFKKTSTLGGLLLRKGRQIQPLFEKNVVHKIPCLQCNAAYIGQTKNSINVRNSQHKALCKPALKQRILKSSKKDNGLAFHHHKTGHQFDFEKTIILGTEKSYWRRLILEGIRIKFSDNLVNLQAGYEIDNIWTPMLEESPAEP